MEQLTDARPNGLCPTCGQPVALPGPLMRVWALHLRALRGVAVLEWRGAAVAPMVHTVALAPEEVDRDDAVTRTAWQRAGHWQDRTWGAIAPVVPMA